jgi:hypothetical protein
MSRSTHCDKPHPTRATRSRSRRDEAALTFQQQGNIDPYLTNPPAATTATADNIRLLRRKRGQQIAKLTVLAKRIDEYEQAGQRKEIALFVYEAQLTDVCKQYTSIHEELQELDDEEDERYTEVYTQQLDLTTRLQSLIKEAQSALPPKPTSGESGLVSEPTPIRLPEIQLPTFDGTIENWYSFYDAFMSTIDRNERLTPVQKFRYLRSSLTGGAARCIQSLDITDLNYSIAIDILKEKFDCHRQVCLRHWSLLNDYPRIITKTPEAVDDLLETVRVHLKALEKLGDPIVSDTVLIALLMSKLPSATIRDWQRTLPNKKLPSHTHLIDFLKTRANGDRTDTTPTATRRRPVQSKTAREPKPRGNAFAVTRSPSTCPICRGNHEIRNCDVFKARSAKRRLEMAKRASICTNCLGKGHSLAQCSAGSCRICNQRHHTYLHRDQAHVKTRSLRGQSSSDRSSIGRSSSGRSSNGRSSSDRSSKGRSPSGSPIPRSSRHTRHSPTPHQASATESPRSRKSTLEHKSRSSQTRSTRSERASHTQKQGKQ